VSRPVSAVPVSPVYMKLPTELVERADALASTTGITRSLVVRVALETYLQQRSAGEPVVLPLGIGTHDK
jgi:metal-responsive CopG/Arc/MetJ family transcriptional regulator